MTADKWKSLSRPVISILSLLCIFSLHAFLPDSQRVPPLYAQEEPVSPGDEPAGDESSAANEVEDEGEDEGENEEPAPLIVGVHHAPPLVFQQEETWDGIAVTLWRQIAEQREIEYELREVDADTALEQLESGAVDILIAAVASPETEQRVDLTHSYLTTELGLARQQDATIFETLRVIFSTYFLWTIFWIALVLVIVAVVIWFFERQANTEMFGGKLHRGLWDSFWWAAVTLQRPPTGTEVPVTVAGRIMALFWMLLAIAITATLTAVLTTMLTAGIRADPLNFPGDLHRLRVGAVEGSAPALLLEEERIGYRSFSSSEEGMQALADEELDVLVHDTATLYFTRSEFATELLEVRSLNALPQHYAFALPEESELVETMDQMILQVITQPGWQDIVARYIP